jgi:hypothetical protein
MKNGDTRKDLFSGRSLIQNIPDVEFEIVLLKIISHIKLQKGNKDSVCITQKLPNELTDSPKTDPTSCQRGRPHMGRTVTFQSGMNIWS